VAENKAVVNDIPFAIGQDIIDRLARFDRSGFAADYAIGNQPWLSSASDATRISRVTTPYQKERVDQAAAAGENTLSNWWLRSATSWHRGEGAEFYDADESDLFRFRESANVDVWTQGQISLLNSTSEVASHGGSYAHTCSLGTWFINGGNVYLYKIATSSVVQVTSFSGTAQALTTDGCNALVGAADGIYEIDSSLATTKLYNHAGSGASWTVQTIGYVKDRIVVGCQITDALPMRVFELGRNPTSPPVNINLSTTSGDSRYEYATTELSFVAVTETTSAILVALNIGVQAKVLSFTIDTSASGSGAMLTPINVAEFPVGEVLRNLKSYLNTYVIAATSRGVRVAEESTSGTGFIYGPLSVEDDITDMAFDGEYVYATRTTERLGAKGLWRIDLGQQVGDFYAFAADLSVSEGTPQSIAFVGTTGLALICTSAKVFIESSTVKAEVGTLDSGFVRYGTTEFKQPVSFSIRSETTNGVLGVQLSDPTGANAKFESIPLGRVLNIPLSVDLLPETEFEVKVTLTRDTSDTSLAPVLQEWQLRALPAPLRSRTITLPLLNYSEEKDSNGVIRVSDPWYRLQALEQLEQTGGACLLQDFSTGDERICVVRAVQYEQSAPPSFVDGFGGMVTVQLQTVDVEIT
jgi:hypothetical protein